MEPDKDKIPSPFETPPGYLEGFESRLAERMARPNAGRGEQLTVTHKRRVNVVWVATAAAAIAVVVTSVFIFMPHKETPIAKQNPVKTDTLAVIQKDTATLFPDSATQEKNALAVVDAILEQASEPAPISSTPVVLPGSADEQVAAELEEAGLIVLTEDNALFDDIEIQP